MALAYALMIAGVNLLNPLLPVIQDDLGLGAAGLAALYSVYLFVLVGVLAVLARVRPAPSPRARLVVAMSCTLVADLVHTVGTLWAIGLGRALLSVSIGVSTGAVAELMVTALGERGRTTTATANVGGALLGTGTAGFVVLVSDDPLRSSFLVHACALALVVCMVSLSTMPTIEPHAGTTASTSPGPGRRPGSATLASGFLMGGLSWVAAASVIVLAPAAFRSAGGELGALVTVLVMGLFAAAFTSQYTVGRSVRRFRGSAAVLVVGMTGLAVGTHQVQRELLFLGGLLVGAGYGAVFRMGMSTVSRGLDERSQGRRASSYAGASYLASCLALVIGGALVDALGGGSAMVLLALLVCVGLVLCDVLNRDGRAPAVAALPSGQPGSTPGAISTERTT